MNFQQLIFTLDSYWADRGCLVLQPYDLEVGAGTFHPATFLRALGPEPWQAAYVQASRRPKDGRYGNNPIRLQHYYQYQVVLKPPPEDIQEYYLDSLKMIGIDLKQHDVRFIEDDWESPTLGAWGLGWEVWLDGLEVTQFTYFQELGSLPCKPVLVEITYGLERLAMCLQGKESVFDLVWASNVTYGDVHHQSEAEHSKFNFESSNVAWLFEQFDGFESEAKRLTETGLPLPGYEMAMKCSHVFNLLDAREAISVTERADYIARVRALARLVAHAYCASRERLGFPLLRQAAPVKNVCEAVGETRERSQGMAGDDSLLIELLTEELPPKSLEKLSAAFACMLADHLRQANFIDTRDSVRAFATPRRLAVVVPRVRAKQAGRIMERKGPSVQVGLEEDGTPSRALVSFAASCDAKVEDIERRRDEKGEYFFFRAKRSGELLAKHLARFVEDAMKRLPATKRMRWSEEDSEFVRPLRGLVMLHGMNIVPGVVFGVNSGNRTRGHRFLGPRVIEITHSEDYEKTLKTRGKVIASFTTRRNIIMRDLDRAATELDQGISWRIGRQEDLLDEVTGTVESPSVCTGSFDAAFLDLPKECLIISMQHHQKYFPLIDTHGALQPHFLFVSNLRLRDPSAIVRGNERVLHARLADAQFFYDQDRKIPLDKRVPQLSGVVFHNKLGSQLERVRRLENLASHVAREMGADVSAATRAAHLSKADLLTKMVREFPELQGVMGGYYARVGGEDAPVCLAIADQYRARFEEVTDHRCLVSASLYLADRIDTLVGFFGIGHGPTGDKDPFGLRRSALGVISVYELLAAGGRGLTTSALPDLRELIVFAVSQFQPGEFPGSVTEAVYDFVLERYRHSLVVSYPKNCVEAVINKKPRMREITARVEAVNAFSRLPEGGSLLAINKRVRNILRKTQAPDGELVEGLLTGVERKLHHAVHAAEQDVSMQIRCGDYAGALQTIVSLRGAVDHFFKDILVNVDDPQIRSNRHALLRRLYRVMNEIADISSLSE